MYNIQKNTCLYCLPKNLEVGNESPTGDLLPACKIFMSRPAIYIIFERLDNYHPKIKFTSKLNPKKFLDKKLICVSSVFNIMIMRK